jgi:hypothetical protein
MPAYAGWGTEPYGSRNCLHGEYDSCLYFTVWLGLPVYLSFRGCVHVIEAYRVQPPERLDRLRHFARTYLGLAALPAAVHLPLKPLPRLRRLVIYDLGLWLLAIFPVLAAIATLGTARHPDELTPGLLAFLAGSWAGAVAFVACLAAYLATRRPSARQARVREVVGGRLGPYSDPADWSAGLLGRLAPALDIRAEDTEDAVRQAERCLRAGRYADALVAARVAVGLVDDPGEADLAGRAEEVTDECLWQLGDDLPGRR